VDGIALAVQLRPDQHLFDLLNCEEAGWATLPGKPETYVRAYIPRKDVACIAQLTRRLLVQRRGDELAVEARLPGEDCELLVAARGSRVLLFALATPSTWLELNGLPPKVGLTGR
jgi:hypothetical protein